VSLAWPTVGQRNRDRGRRTEQGRFVVVETADEWLRREMRPPTMLLVMAGDGEPEHRKPAREGGGRDWQKEAREGRQGWLSGCGRRRGKENPQGSFSSPS